MVEVRWYGPSGDGVRSFDRFPFSVGRQGADLVLENPGVWERHLIIERTREFRFVATPQSPAQVMVAGRVLETGHVIANGEVLELGAVRLQFRIAPSRQKSLGALELLTWVGIGLLAVFQLVLASFW